MYAKEPDPVPVALLGEARLLELIYGDAPLAEVLDKICGALDAQLGNVVSVVLSCGDDEHALHELAKRAMQFGLYVFSCCAIVSRSEQLLGTLETYSCFSQRPAIGEARLVQRASELVALAIQEHALDEDAQGFAPVWTGATGRNAHEGHPTEN